MSQTEPVTEHADVAGLVAPGVARPRAERADAAPASRGGVLRHAILLAVWTLALAAFVAIPVRLLYPFRVQTPFEVSLAYDMRRFAPLVTTLGLVPLFGLIVLIARGRRLRWSWIPIVATVAVAGGAAWFARQNHFEWMFEPLPEAVYTKASEATFVGDDDMVIATDSATDTVAFPVLQMAYHHLAMDTLGGVPIVATYCTLCHTGLVWGRTVDGRVLTFHLYGINNQNMLMRDHETGSWWQQATGAAIQGPLQGKRLEPIVHDEISFAVYKRERPSGRVLRPSSAHQDNYAPANWERLMKKRRPTTPLSASATPLPAGAWRAREHVVGVVVEGGQAKAYPFPAIRRGGPVNDVVGGVPVLIVVGEDHKSVRVFERTVNGRTLELIVKAGVRPLALADLETGSEWDFAGKATSGPLAGATLGRVWASKEYWFNWKRLRPHTKKYNVRRSPAPSPDAELEAEGDGA